MSCLEVNDAVCAMLGYTREELMALSWPTITHPDDIGSDISQFKRLAAGEIDRYSVEKRYIHKDGRHVWARLAVSLVRDACVVTDVVIPGMDGTELAAKLRAKRPTLPILFMTAHAGSRALSGEVVLRKPFSEADLSRNVMKMLARRASPIPADGLAGGKQPVTPSPTEIT